MRRNYHKLLSVSLIVSSFMFTATLSAQGTDIAQVTEENKETKVENKKEADTEIKEALTEVKTEVEEAAGEVKAAVEAELKASVVEAAEKEKVAPENAQKAVAVKKSCKKKSCKKDTITWTPNVEARLRGEFKHLGSRTHFIGSRARVGLRAKYKLLTVNIQVQDARKFGFAGTDDGAITGIHEGYFQLGTENSWLRAGRQEISYGAQRMIGALNWADQARSFDALRFHINLGDALQFDGFGATLAKQNTLQAALDPTAPAGTVAETGITDGDYLAGLYMIYTPLKSITVEPYLLFRHNGPTFANLDNNQNIASFGLRTTGAFERGYGYDLEGDVQTGNRNEDSHFAFAAAGNAYYAPAVMMKPKMSLGFAYASGQSANGNVDEFDNFFPTNHKFYGAADLFSWRNLIQADLTLSAQLLKTVNAKIMVAPTATADTDGRWSNAGGKTIGTGTSDSMYMGTEVDFNTKWTPMEYFALSSGYSIFIPGKGASDRLGSGTPVHWAYLMAGVKF